MKLLIIRKEVNRYDEFEMPVGMPNGSIKKTFEYRGLKFRREA